MIKNVSQLKRTLTEGVRFEIIDHCKPEYIGQIRRVTLSTGNNFYSVVDGEPGHESNRANGGKGIVLWWMKARFWTFRDGLCITYTSDKKHEKDSLIMAFRILDEEEQ